LSTPHRREQEASSSTVPTLAVYAETLRRPDPSLFVPLPPAHPEKSSEERVSLFWRIFGGTLLSIVALVCITIVQQLFASMSELRNNLVHLQEAQSGLVKKDEYATRSTNMWNSIREAQALKETIVSLKEQAQIREQQLRTIEQEHKEMTREVQSLRERLAALEGQQKNRTSPKPMSKDDSE
jgi:septal ring factor EnvC (AmiA/AmiB activator)